MKDFKINELRAISCIAEERQISAAATKMGSSQANFSRLLTGFEESIGLKIFHRSTRSLTTTEFGEVLLTRIKNLLESHDDVLDFIEAYKKKPFGHITIAAPAIAIAFFTRHIMPSIATAHPDISISFVTYQLATSLDDVGVVMSPDWDILFSLHQPKDETLVARSVAMFSMGIFASPHYLAKHPIEHPQELTDHSCILIEMLGRRENTWQYRDPDRGEVINFVVTGSYVCDQIQPAIELAKNGLGVLYAPLYSVLDELDAGTLVPCLPGLFQVEHPHYLVYRKRNYQPYRINIIIDSVIKYLEHYTTLLR